MQRSIPALYAPTAQAAKRFVEYFAANIRNRNTRAAYMVAVARVAEATNLRGLYP